MENDEQGQHGWHFLDLTKDRMPPGCIQLQLVDGGFIHVHVDVIALYGPSSSLQFEHSTALQLRGESRKEARFVRHSLPEIAEMYRRAKLELEQFKSRP